MKHKIQLGIGITLIIIIFAFKSQNGPLPVQNNYSKTMAEEDTLAILRTLLNTDVLRKDTVVKLGRIVSINSALDCSYLFPPEMQDHAIQDNTKPVTVRITRAQQITTSEIFRGKDLLEWMIKIVNSKKGIPLTPKEIQDIEIHVVFGIYTEDFLKTYLPNDPQERAARRGRITAFLIPYRKSNGKPFRDGDDTAYELGGLRP